MSPRHPERQPMCCDLEHSETVEDYLKAIYHLDCRGEPTTTSEIARALDVSAPSVSTMMSRLADAGLAERSDDRQVRLTGHGMRHAREVVRRHRLVETFLAEVGVPWDEVHAEAEVLEHALSANLTDRIDDWLGRPERDPHGDPIPPRDGDYAEEWPAPLRAAPRGARFVVDRVSDRDSAALRYLGEMGIRPGTPLVVEDWDPFGGPLWVTVGGERVALGEQLTHLVRGVVAERNPRTGDHGEVST
ncbi:MAG: MarR family transcriptional regulator [Pseudonocardiaceae bacterium]|nr:MarR family transcriptional regulator [Pseudonocardiaceae bacterium]